MVRLKEEEDMDYPAGLGGEAGCLNSPQTHERGYVDSGLRVLRIIADACAGVRSPCPVGSTEQRSAAEAAAVAGDVGRGDGGEKQKR